MKENYLYMFCNVYGVYECTVYPLWRSCIYLLSLFANLFLEDRVPNHTIGII